MAAKFIFNLLIVVITLFAVVYSTPVPSAEGSDEDTQTLREERFYGGGLSSSQASAMASSGAGGFGYPGFGRGGSEAFAQASAHSGSMGFGK